jgi:hypothetical protein
VLNLKFSGAAYGGGFMVNCNDIAGSYSGLLFGISNTFASFPGFLTPFVVGLLTKNVGDSLSSFEQCKDVLILFSTANTRRMGNCFLYYSSCFHYRSHIYTYSWSC